MAVADHRYSTLDAMRGVAAIAVACMHFNRWIVPNFFASGYLAVDMFFVLSGFVISYAFDDRLRTTLSLKDFFVARAIRFWPVLALGVAIGGVKLAALIPAGKADYSLFECLAALVANAMLIPFQLGDNLHAFRPNQPSWTLFFELWVNVAYALLIRFLSVRVLSAIAAISLITICILLGAGETLHSGGDFGDLHIGVLRTIFSFSVGVLLSRTKGSWSGRIPKVGMLPVLVLTGCTFVVVAAGIYERLYQVAFVALLSPVLIMLGSQVQLGERQKRLALWLAAVSYPLYALNIPVRDLVPLGLFRAGVPPLAVAAVLLPALIAVSATIERRYDEPIRNWLKGRYRRIKSS